MLTFIFFYISLYYFSQQRSWEVKMKNNMDLTDFFSNFAVGSSGVQCQWTTSNGTSLTADQLNQLKQQKLLTIRRGDVQKVYYCDPKTESIWKTMTNENVSVTDIRRALMANNLL